MGGGQRQSQSAAPQKTRADEWLVWTAGISTVQKLNAANRTEVVTLGYDTGLLRGEGTQG